MPLYEYCCILCNKKEEAMQNHGEPPIICSDCNEPMFKMVSSTSFVLKGDGWEKDGYTGESNRKKQS